MVWVSDLILEVNRCTMLLQDCLGSANIYQENLKKATTICVTLNGIVAGFRRRIKLQRGACYHCEIV